MTNTSDNEVSPKCYSEWISKKAVANAGVAVVSYDKEILILKRKIGSTKNFWELPCGGIDRGEEPQIAAQRELKEEIKMELDSKHLKEIITVWAHNPDKTDIVITFLAYPVKKKCLRLGDEHSKFHWLPIKKYNTTVYPMNEATRKQIKAAYDIVFQEKRNQP